MVTKAITKMCAELRDVILANEYKTFGMKDYRVLLDSLKEISITKSISDEGDLTYGVDLRITYPKDEHDLITVFNTQLQDFFANKYKKREVTSRLFAVHIHHDHATITYFVHANNK